MTKFISEAERDYILAFAKDYANSDNFEDLFESYPGSWFSGSTKKVFVLDELENWVIKIDLSKEPYCQREADNYAAAVRENLAEYFAATYFFTEIDGVKFYIQELLDCHDDFGDDLSGEVSQACFNYLKNTSDFEDNDDIWDAVSDMSDIERVYALIPGASYRLEGFLSRHEIDDLHDGNFGRRAGEYVIMDFSGYNIIFEGAA